METNIYPSILFLVHNKLTKLLGKILQADHPYFKIYYMSVEILTKEDLQVFRMELLNDLKILLFVRQSTKKEWLRSSEIRKALKISAGTLQNLPVTGKLKPVKIGGILLYRNSDLEGLLEAENENLQLE